MDNNTSNYNTNDDEDLEKHSYERSWNKNCRWLPYKTFTRSISILLIILMSWCLLYGIVPELIKPGGKLFDFLLLVLLSYAAGNLLFKLTTLPALIGMLFTGVMLQNTSLIQLEGHLSLFTYELRRIALVIILTRAGLSLDPVTVKKLYCGILKLGLIPWVVECVVFALFGHCFLGLRWDWAFLLSCIIASVSPAVVVPCFIKLQCNGYGVDKGIPTLILAAASIDDTTSIAVYGVISSIMFTQPSLLMSILQVPITIIGGIAFGIFWGYALAFTPAQSDTFMSHLRVILLFLGGYLSVSISSVLGYAGAGPLAVITASFVSSCKWSNVNWNVNNNPVKNTFRISWIFFEPILFGLTGTQVKLTELNLHIVGIGSACLFSSVIIRIITTIVISNGSDFNFKEKLFIGMSWMAKATVQAALGPLALNHVKSNGGTEKEIEYAETLLMICILSIALTAPIGAILISIAGPRFLKKSSTENYSLNKHPDDQKIAINCELENLNQPNL